MIRARALLAIAVVAMLAGCAAEAPTPAAAPTTKPGFVEVDGHQLAADCSGSGDTTVVFLHGLGGDSSDWELTRSLLGDVSTCNYDRVNVARSDSVEGRHNVADSVDELHEVLGQLDAKGPYLLVAHSFAGLVALMYASTYPDEVKGILFADSTLPLEADLDPEEIRDAVRDDMDANVENVDFYEGYADTAAVLDNLPDVPMVYISATLADKPKEWAPGAYDAALDAFFASLPQGSVVRMEATHHLPRQHPQEMADQITELLAR